MNEVTKNWGVNLSPKSPKKNALRITIQTRGVIPRIGLKKSLAARHFQEYHKLATNMDINSDHARAFIDEIHKNLKSALDGHKFDLYLPINYSFTCVKGDTIELYVAGIMSVFEIGFYIVEAQDVTV